MAKTRKTYTAELKLQAVRQVIDQHLAVAEVARRLGITEGRRHDWLKAVRAQGADAFPGHGRLAPHEEERHRLRAEVQRLKAERDIRKKTITRFKGGVLRPATNTTRRITALLHWFSATTQEPHP